MGANAVIIAAAAAQQRQRILQQLTQHDAFDAARAITLDIPSRIAETQLARLCASGIVRKSASGTYFLDQLRQRELDAAARVNSKYALMFAMAVIVVVLGVMLYSYTS